MKHTNSAFVALLVLLTGTSVGLSQPMDERSTERGRSRRQNPITVAIDVDGDGQLSAAEIAGAAARLRTLDTNGDGKLSGDEIRTPGGGGQGRGGRGGGGQRGGQRGGQGRGGSRQQGPEAVFRTEVPRHAMDVILARPTDCAVTICVLAYQEAEGYVEYGTRHNVYTHQASKTRWPAATPQEIVLNGLESNTRYYYRVHHGDPGSGDLQATPEYSFHTHRPPGSTYTFTVQADAHLDSPTSPEIYLQTLANASAVKPDFHVDLGDTFMTDKYSGDYRASGDQYLAQRYYLGGLCHSAPFFFVIGNHDGEAGRWLDGTADSMGVWSHRMRTTLFPTPVPDGFYSGNSTEILHIGLPQNYYAWHWGDALMIVLDPYWPTTLRTRQANDYWNRTLGREQYDWLQATLQASPAKFKFVFIHHLVGGLDSSGRGGAEAASYFEWGGKSLDGRDEFATKRPGWEMPIHRMLVENNVSVVFHGHDHFFAKQDLDGIVYQLVPQPAHAKYGNIRTAAEYGYVQGDILAGSGHMRVTVSPEAATIDYVLSVLPRDKGRYGRNGDVAHSFSIDAPNSSTYNKE